MFFSETPPLKAKKWVRTDTKFGRVSKVWECSTRRGRKLNAAHEGRSLRGTLSQTLLETEKGAAGPRAGRTAERPQSPDPDRQRLEA